jgi:hypothetical protein
MEPYYNGWANSAHNKVACVKCHFSPGISSTISGRIQIANMVLAYLSNTYSTRFYAEIEDASCMRSGCHENRRVSDTLVTFMRNIGFSHKHHLGELRRGVKLRCTSCHSQLVVGKHIAVTEEVCILCHFKDRTDSTHLADQAFCTRCHGIPSDDIQIKDSTYNHKDFTPGGISCRSCHLDAAKGTGKVDKSRCFSCHPDPKHQARSADGEFMHLNHVTKHRVECNLCHDAIIHSVRTTLTLFD